MSAILAGVALLAALSALTLARFDRLRRRYVGTFFVCLVAIWAVAVLVIALIGHTI